MVYVYVYLVLNEQKQEKRKEEGPVLRKMLLVYKA